MQHEKSQKANNIKLHINAKTSVSSSSFASSFFFCFCLLIDTELKRRKEMCNKCMVSLGNLRTAKRFLIPFVFDPRATYKRFDQMQWKKSSKNFASIQFFIKVHVKAG